MGVSLGELIIKEKLTLEDLAGKVIAIDAYNTLYQFISIIRLPDGSPLTDSKGRVTSHLTGLLYRTTKFIEAGILPCFVFDGKPPEEKEKEITARTAVRAEAHAKWQDALERGEMEEARKHAQASLKLSREMVDDAKALLDAMGVPYVQAPSEGEAQAAYMAQRKEAYAVASQDFDALLFGTPVLVRNLAVTGKRKLPGRSAYVEVEPERIELKRSLEQLGITREQLVELALMIGTDYNAGIPRVGPKTALKLVKEGKTVEQVYKEKGIEPEADISFLHSFFLKPPVISNYKLEWRKPNATAIIEHMVKEHEFSQERVEKVIKTLTEKTTEVKAQTRLGAWS